jgi:hypothetical protein
MLSYNVAFPLSLSSFNSFVIVHRDDHVPLPAPLLDVPVSLNDLRQRVAPFDNRLHLARLYRFSEAVQVLGTILTSPAVTVVACTITNSSLSSGAGSATSRT